MVISKRAVSDGLGSGPDIISLHSLSSNMIFNMHALIPSHNTTADKLQNDTQQEGDVIISIPERIESAENKLICLCCSFDIISNN